MSSTTVNGSSLCPSVCLESVDQYLQNRTSLKLTEIDGCIEGGGQRRSWWDALVDQNKVVGNPTEDSIQNDAEPESFAEIKILSTFSLADKNGDLRGDCVTRKRKHCRNYSHLSKKFVKYDQVDEFAFTSFRSKELVKCFDEVIKDIEDPDSIWCSTRLMSSYKAQTSKCNQPRVEPDMKSYRKDQGFRGVPGKIFKFEKLFGRVLVEEGLCTLNNDYEQGLHQKTVTEVKHLPAETATSDGEIAPAGAISNVSMPVCDGPKDIVTIKEEYINVADCSMEATADGSSSKPMDYGDPIFCSKELDDLLEEEAKRPRSLFTVETITPSLDGVRFETPTTQRSYTRTLEFAMSMKAKCKAGVPTSKKECNSVDISASEKSMAERGTIFKQDRFGSYIGANRCKKNQVYAEFLVSLDSEKAKEAASAVQNPRVDNMNRYETDKVKFGGPVEGKKLGAKRHLIYKARRITAKAVAKETLLESITSSERGNMPPSIGKRYFSTASQADDASLGHAAQARSILCSEIPLEVTAVKFEPQKPMCKILQNEESWRKSFAARKLLKRSKLARPSILEKRVEKRDEKLQNCSEKIKLAQTSMASHKENTEVPKQTNMLGKTDMSSRPLLPVFRREHFVVAAKALHKGQEKKVQHWGDVWRFFAVVSPSAGSDEADDVVVNELYNKDLLLFRCLETSRVLKILSHSERWVVSWPKIMKTILKMDIRLRNSFRMVSHLWTVAAEIVEDFYVVLLLRAKERNESRSYVPRGVWKNVKEKGNCLMSLVQIYKKGVRERLSDLIDGEDEATALTYDTVQLLELDGALDCCDAKQAEVCLRLTEKDVVNWSEAAVLPSVNQDIPAAGLHMKVNPSKLGKLGCAVMMTSARDLQPEDAVAESVGEESMLGLISQETREGKELPETQNFVKSSGASDRGPSVSPTVCCPVIVSSPFLVVPCPSEMPRVPLSHQSRDFGEPKLYQFSRSTVRVLPDEPFVHGVRKEHVDTSFEGPETTRDAARVCGAIVEQTKSAGSKKRSTASVGHGVSGICGLALDVSKCIDRTVFEPTITPAVDANVSMASKLSSAPPPAVVTTTAMSLIRTCANESGTIPTSFDRSGRCGLVSGMSTHIDLPGSTSFNKPALAPYVAAVVSVGRTLSSASLPAVVGTTTSSLISMSASSAGVPVGRCSSTGSFGRSGRCGLVSGMATYIDLPGSTFGKPAMAPAVSAAVSVGRTLSSASPPAVVGTTTSSLIRISASSAGVPVGRCSTSPCASAACGAVDSSLTMATSFVTSSSFRGHHPGGTFSRPFFTRFPVADRPRALYPQRGLKHHAVCQKTGGFVQLPPRNFERIRSKPVCSVTSTGSVSVRGGLPCPSRTEKFSPRFSRLYSGSCRGILQKTPAIAPALPDSAQQPCESHKALPVQTKVYAAYVRSCASSSPKVSTSPRSSMTFTFAVDAKPAQRHAGKFVGIAQLRTASASPTKSAARSLSVNPATSSLSPRVFGKVFGQNLVAPLRLTLPNNKKGGDVPVRCWLISKRANTATNAGGHPRRLAPASGAGTASNSPLSPSFSNLTPGSSLVCAEAPDGRSVLLSNAVAYPGGAGAASVRAGSTSVSNVLQTPFCFNNRPGASFACKPVPCGVPIPLTVLGKNDASHALTAMDGAQGSLCAATGAAQCMVVSARIAPNRSNNTVSLVNPQTGDIENCVLEPLDRSRRPSNHSAEKRADSLLAGESSTDGRGSFVLQPVTSGMDRVPASVGRKQGKSTSLTPQTRCGPVNAGGLTSCSSGSVSATAASGCGLGGTPSRRSRFAQRDSGYSEDTSKSFDPVGPQIDPVLSRGVSHPFFASRVVQGRPPLGGHRQAPSGSNEPLRTNRLLSVVLPEKIIDEDLAQIANVTRKFADSDAVDAPSAVTSCAPVQRNDSSFCTTMADMNATSVSAATLSEKRDEINDCCTMDLMACSSPPYVTEPSRLSVHTVTTSESSLFRQNSRVGESSFSESDAVTRFAEVCVESVAYTQSIGHGAALEVCSGKKSAGKADVESTCAKNSIFAPTKMSTLAESRLKDAVVPTAENASMLIESPLRQRSVRLKNFANTSVEASVATKVSVATSRLAVTGACPIATTSTTSVPVFATPSTSASSEVRCAVPSISSVVADPGLDRSPTSCDIKVADRACQDRLPLDKYDIEFTTKEKKTSIDLKTLAASPKNGQEKPKRRGSSKLRVRMTKKTALKLLRTQDGDGSRVKLKVLNRSGMTGHSLLAAVRRTVKMTNVRNSRLRVRMTRKTAKELIRGTKLPPERFKMDVVNDLGASGKHLFGAIYKAVGQRCGKMLPERRSQFGGKDSPHRGEQRTRHGSDKRELKRNGSLGWRANATYGEPITTGKLSVRRNKSGNKNAVDRYAKVDARYLSKAERLLSGNVSEEIKNQAHTQVEGINRSNLNKDWSKPMSSAGARNIFDDILSYHAGDGT